MSTDKQIPLLDIPKDFMAGENISGDILELYRQIPCRMQSAFFVLVLEGTAQVTINISTYDIKPGNFIIHFPGSFIQIRELDRNIHFNYAAFSSAFINQLNLIGTNMNYFSRVIENPVISLPDGMRSYYEEYFRFLIQVFKNDEIRTNNKILGSLLDIFIQQTHTLYNGQNQSLMTQIPLSRDKEIYMKFIQLLMKNYTTRHEVQWYAREIGLTLQHFSNSIKKVSGNTASGIISDIIILDAKAQLKSTSLLVKQIALSLGFANVSSFHKFFRHHTAMTPQEYRES